MSAADLRGGCGSAGFAFAADAGLICMWSEGRGIFDDFCFLAVRLFGDLGECCNFAGKSSERCNSAGGLAITLSECACGVIGSRVRLRI